MFLNNLLTMKTILWFAVLIAVASAIDDYHVTFGIYTTKYSKNYTASEMPLRMSLYKNRSMMIEKHNAEAAAGLHSYTMEANQLADLTDEEIRRKLGAVPPLHLNRSESGVSRNDRAIPSTSILSVDLRTSGCIPAIENQANCGSCWAFSATAPIEYQYCMKYGQSVYFSEQQLVSCMTGITCTSGGWYTWAWSYLQSVGGQVTADAYPYTSSSGITGTCLSKTSTIKATISTWNWVYPYRSETALANAVVAYGPISVAIAVNSNFVYYKSGVFDDPTCPTNTINHAVALVGYGTDCATGKDYWIVRNQWGASWGQRGYILMRRGVNMCNINGYGAYPIVA